MISESVILIDWAISNTYPLKMEIKSGFHFNTLLVLSVFVKSKISVQSLLLDIAFWKTVDC